MKTLISTRNERKIAKFLKLILFLSTCFVFVGNIEFLRQVFEKETGNFLYQSQLYGSNYCVIYNFWHAKEPYLSGDFITLVLHSTPGYIGYLEEQLQTWDGTISVAFFIPAPYHLDTSSPYATSSLFLAHFIYVLSTLDHLKNTGRVSLHLFFEKLEFTSCPIVQLRPLEGKFSVDDLRSFGPINLLYPINVARNIARQGSKTKLFLSTDIENIFVPNYEPRMKKLANKVLLKEKHQTVLVHRRFEIEIGLPIPRSKLELYHLYKKKKAIEFHAKFYGIAHRIPKLKEWFLLGENNETTSVFMEKHYDNAEWEPQFVVDARVPYHDESFSYRLWSNTHLASELCRANFTFSIVNDLFSVHRGIKRSYSLAEKEARRVVERGQYLEVEKKFYERLDKQYPKTKFTCPRFRH